MPRFASLCKAVQAAALAALLLFGPLTGGATKRWSFGVSLLLALLAAGAMVLKRTWQGRRIWPASTLDLPLAILLFLSLLSLLFTIYRPATQWAVLRLVLYGLVFYLAVDLADSRRLTKGFLWLVTAVGLGLCFLGLVKYFDGPVPLWWSYSPESQADFFLATYLNHNHIAGYFEMALCLGLGLLLAGAVEWSLVWSASLLLMAVCLVLTMARGGWISLAAGAAFVLAATLLKRNVGRTRTVLAGAVLVVVLALAVLGSGPAMERFQTLDNPAEPTRLGRVAVWEASLDLLRERPFTGHGLGSFPWTFPSVRPAGQHLHFDEAHNDYLQLLLDLGLPALIPLIMGLVLLWSKGLENIRLANGRFSSGLAIGGLGAVLAILVHSVSDFNLQLTANGVLFSFILGLALSADRFRALEPEPPVEPVEIPAQDKEFDFMDGSGQPLGREKGPVFGPDSGEER